MFSFAAELLKNFFAFVGLVKTRSNFPAPLSSEEERILIEKMNHGDAEARDSLIEHNLRLVAHIAKKYATKERDSDDLISIGTIGLIKAVGTFSNEKGRTIAAYASKCIENEILMSIRSERKQKNEVSISEPIGFDRDGNEITLADIIAGEEDVSEEVEKRSIGNELRMAVNNVLSARERRVIELRYGLIDGLAVPQWEVGKELNISRSYVSRIEKKALKKLNCYLVESSRSNQDSRVFSSSDV